MRTPLLLGVLLAAGAAAQEPTDERLRNELQQLRRELADTNRELGKRAAQLERSENELAGMARALGTLEQRVRLGGASLLAQAFLSAPPPPSDLVGVAKVVVSAPRLEVDSPQRHDILFVKLLRLEPEGPELVAERELIGSEYSLALPVDVSGALYQLNWSTSEGFNYPLVVRDGLTLHQVAVAQVKPQQREGSFLFVGYRAANFTN